MYCINCGAELADTERSCPLCKTDVYHPQLSRPEAVPLYPPDRYPERKRAHLVLPVFLTAFLLAVALTVLLCDLQVHGCIVWCGYVIGAMGAAYVMGVLPLWFRKPNPVIFVPCSFVALGLYLLYISVFTGGGWFLSFAFPVTGCVGLIVTAVVTLFRYVRRGRLYILGGALTALGLLMPLVELLSALTFRGGRFVWWSAYPLIGLVLLGGLLLYLAISPTARETAERKLFF